MNLSKTFKAMISLFLIIAAVSALFVMPVSASSAVDWNISYSPASGNLDTCALPASAETVNCGDRVYINLAIGNSGRLKEVRFFVKGPGEGSYHLAGTERARNYLRYAYTEYTVGWTAGTLYYYIEIDSVDGRSGWTGEYSINVVNNGWSHTPSVQDKINEFLSDSRWMEGKSWGYYQRPKVSGYGSIGCCAYAADWAKQIFGKNSPRDGAVYYSSGDIREGDIIYVTPQHWMCVISRSGDTIKVAEGNYNSSVHVGTYIISGSSLYYTSWRYYKSFSCGYHFT